MAVCLLAFLAGVNFYRAATQSITADEAFTYNHYAGGDEPLKFYDANHHVLFSLLARASVSAFGLSEFTLRLPSLLAGCGFLAGVFWLSRCLFGSSWLFLLAVVSLSLNPFVLDFLSAARGYGLALAFLVWALYHLARRLEEDAGPGARRLHAAAACLALAVAANLNFAAPGAALAAVFCLLDVWRWPPVGRRFLWLVRHFLGPGLALVVAILAWPLRTAERSLFYFGVETLRQTRDGLLFYSVCHGGCPMPTRLQGWLWDISRWLVPGVVALSGLLCGILIAQAARRGLSRLDRLDRFLMLAGGTSLGALALLVAAWRGFGLKYPVDRTALYWIPLFTMLCLCTIGVLRRWRAAFLAVGLPLIAFLVLVGAQYALQFNTRYYAQWRYDAATRQIVNLIRERQDAEAKLTVRIGATWLFESSLNFYRQRYGMNWLARITREGPRGACDYYVLHGDDLGLVDELDLEVLYRDRLSGTVLAVPAGVLQSGP